MELLTVGLTTVLMPTMGHAFGAHGLVRVHEIFRKAMRYFMFLGILLAGASCFLAPPVVALLYGSEYGPVAFALQVMQVVGGLTMSEAAIGSLLATTGRQSVWAKVMLIPMGISAIAAPLLVPEYGIAGALISLTIARVIGCAVLAVVAVRGQSVHLPWRSFGGLVGSGLAAALLALGTQVVVPGVAGQILASVVFTVALLVLSFPLGAWQRNDAALVNGLISRVPRSEPLLRPIERYLQRLQD
jgi:O-antigen/teichoic acid export membrane protein